MQSEDQGNGRDTLKSQRKQQGVIYCKFRGQPPCIILSCSPYGTEVKPYITHLFSELIGPAVNFYRSSFAQSREQWERGGTFQASIMF